jgi:signal transduction histidine kinase
VTAGNDKVCLLLQEIGLPAVRLNPGTAEVIGCNELFSSLVNPAAGLEQRLWFTEGVLPGINGADRAAWRLAFAGRTPVQVQAEFESAEGRTLEFEMRSTAFAEAGKVTESVLCVFISLTTPTFERRCDARLSEGQEMERTRMRNELHRGVSQQLLGAAFGCKVLAGKVAKLNESLGNEASALAELVNEAVNELQSLVKSNQTQSKSGDSKSGPGGVCAGEQR